MVGGIPQSTKLAPPDEAGLSKDALFRESKSGEEAASEESEAPLAGLAELEGAIWVQTAMLQSQLTTQQWLASKMEHVAVALDRHHVTVEELLAALTSIGWGFGARLGVGLDTWAMTLLHGEWGGIRVTQEGASDSDEDEYEQ